MDVYDRIQAEDMKQASVIIAAFVYNAAMRDEKLPRKPLPPNAGRAGRRRPAASGAGRQTARKSDQGKSEEAKMNRRRSRAEKG